LELVDLLNIGVQLLLELGLDLVLLVQYIFLLLLMSSQIFGVKVWIIGVDLVD